MSRTAQRNRETKETKIKLSVDVDGAGETTVSTGLPFFDHMLSQLGKHSGMNLAIDGTTIAAGSAAIGLFFAFWSWVGFETTAVYGEESRNPKRKR